MPIEWCVSGHVGVEGTWWGRAVLAQLKWASEWEQGRVGGREGGSIKGGAGFTAATPHHGNSCLVMLRDDPWSSTSHLLLFDKSVCEEGGREGGNWFNVSVWCLLWRADRSEAFEWHYQWITTSLQLRLHYEARRKLKKNESGRISLRRLFHSRDVINEP